jgi:large subunit ribosomal protein L30
MADQAKKLKLKLMKGIGRVRKDHCGTVRGLGLKWTNHTVEVVDTPQTRGMINQVRYLVRIVE